MSRLILAFAGLLVFAGAVSAETYKWVDDSGTINFTEDYSQVPKKYRKKVKVIGGMEAEPVSDGVAAEESGKEGAAKSPAATESDSDKSGETKKKMYGGKSEEQWRNDFKKMNDQIERVKSQIDERKSKLNNPDGLSRARYRGIEIEIRDLEDKLTGLKSNLSDLDREASAAGVPYDIRR